MIHISKGNSKIGNIPNFSLVPVKDCGNCSSCAKKCYALKAFRMYPAVKKAWEENSVEVRREQANTWVFSMMRYLERKNPKLFRIHVAGDFISQDYLDSWKELARSFPKTSFLAFTKMHDLDYSNMPKNLNIVFSMFPGMEKPNTNMPMAWAKDNTENRIPKNAQKCAGTCDTCGICWYLGKGKHVYFDMH